MTELLDWIASHKDLVQATTSMIAVFIGFTSILLTVLTLRASRKHQRLSVKPLASISVRNIHEELSISLGNDGTGPMIVTGFRVRRGSSSKPNLSEFFPPMGPIAERAVIAENFLHSAIRPADSFLLFTYKLNPESREEVRVRELFREALGHLTLEVQYSDIYGTEMPKYIKPLAWFHRTLVKPVSDSPGGSSA